MSRHEPLGGDSYDAGQAQEGNRPAQNARLTTPGSLSTDSYQGGAGAGDFLGLDAEVGGNGSAFGLMAEPEAAPAEAPEASAWVETSRVRERAAAAAEEAYDESAEEGVEGDDSDAALEGDVHGSWSESAPKRGGVGKLVGAAAGVLVLGMLGVAGMKFMGAAGDDAATTEPVASRATPRPERNAGLSAPVPVEDSSASERTALDTTGASADAQPAGALTGSGATEVDPQAAREAFEEKRGDEPPAWFDPTLDSQSVPAETGWSAEAEAVTRASIFVGDPMALLVAETVADAPSADDSAAATTPAESAPAIVSTPITIVASASDAIAEPGTPAAVEPSATAVTPAASSSTSAPAPVVVASAPTTPPPAPVANDDGSVGPTAPAGSDTLLPPGGAVAAFQESRQSRTSTLQVEDVLLAPTMDSSNLRQADAKDLSGVWNETSVPMQAMSSKTKVLTPNVGRVRVVLTSKDIFEGRLYAVGMGSVWLESEYGRISVDGKRIASVANIDTKEGTPALGSSGSQNLTGLEKVRVKTPGGTFYGKVIARDDKETTLITEDGARLTLSNTDVEFLTDAPKVTIGGKVEDAPKKP